MVEKLKIEDMSYEGSGVARLKGKVVFVPKTLQNEVVKAEIVRDAKSFMQARAVEILTPSPERVDAFCPYFDICGGCDFQHCTREFEQKCKLKNLKKELAKVGYDGEIEFVCASKRFSYRNKIKLEVKNEQLGYFKTKSHEFFEVKYCPIALPEINDAIAVADKFLKKNRLENLLNVTIKVVGQKVGICFLFSQNDKKISEKTVDFSVFGDIFVFFAYGNVLESNSTQIFQMSGKGDFPMSSFNQINDEVAKLLYDFVISKTSNKKVVNAYSGQGQLSNLIAQKAEMVFGIECQKSAHLQALKIAPSNVKNVCAKVEDVLGDIVQKQHIDTIVLDPAREGCKQTALDAILSSGAKQVVYVSCNYSTLVRDLMTLKQKYAIFEVCAFDMFPCTANIETVATLRLV